MFNGNAFSSIDTPPPLNVSALKAESPTDLEASINNDPSFLKALQGNSDALAAVHNVLYNTYKQANDNGTDSAATKTTVINAAQADITALTFGSSAGALVTQAVNQISNLTSNNNASLTTAISNLFSGQTLPQITAELNNLNEVATAFTAMQTESTTSSNTIDTSTFFGTANKGNLAQTALVAAAVSALVADNPGGLNGLAQQLANGETPTTNNPATNLNALTADLSNSNPPASDTYAYVSASLSFIPGH
jgi:hypothetical protein